MSDQQGWARTFTGNTLVNNGNWPGVGMMIWRPGDSATDITIKNNKIYRVGSFALGVQELEANGAHPNVNISDNYIEDADQSDTLDTEALRVRTFSGSSPVIVSDNIINKTKSGSNTHPGIYLYGASGAKIYNNTIYGADQGILVKAASTGNNIRNNISYNNRQYGIKLEDTSTVTTFSNNLFYNNTTSNYSGTSAGNGDIVSNPNVVSSSDFHLQSTSPAINAGTDVGLTSDYAGSQIVGLPDIGAFEYQGDVTPPAAPGGLSVS
jgi:parallel beta-helix repeat protein